jgi:hypothetical protein
MFTSSKSIPVSATCQHYGLFVLAVIGLIWWPPALSQNQSQLAGIWHGTLVAAQFDPLDIVLHIHSADAGDTYTATLDIPTQFRTDLPVAAISLKNSNVLVSIPALDAEFFGSLVFDTSGLQVLALNGDWSQSGEHIPLRLERSN